MPQWSGRARGWSRSLARRRTKCNREYFFSPLCFVVGFRWSLPTFCFCHQEKKEGLGNTGGPPFVARTWVLPVNMCRLTDVAEFVL
jgi:hypothetical protein